MTSVHETTDIPQQPTPGPVARIHLWNEINAAVRAGGLPVPRAVRFGSGWLTMHHDTVTDLDLWAWHIGLKTARHLPVYDGWTVYTADSQPPFPKGPLWWGWHVQLICDTEASE